MSVWTTIGRGVSEASDATPLHLLTGAARDAAGGVASAGLNAVASWVLDGTRSALEQVANLISAATSPDLSAAWFSASYWRVAGLAALLTVPFVFAAMVQAVLRSDLALVARVVFVHLPLSLLAVSVAAPVTMLLLAATDQMCAAVSGAAVNGGAHFLDQAAAAAGGLGALDGSPFFAVMAGLLTVAAALMLACELLIREAAVYVVVLMLPIAFAAFVWPARRIWAIRLVELLISLILSKFVIVAVLSLAGSAFANGNGSIPMLLTAMSLLLLSIFAPWVLLRIIPFTELGASAAAALRHEVPQVGSKLMKVAGAAELGASELAAAIPQVLRHQADQAGQGAVGFPETSPAASVETPAGVEMPGAPSDHQADAAAVTPAAADAPSESDEPRRFPLEIDPELLFNAGPGESWVSEDEL